MIVITIYRLSLVNNKQGNLPLNIISQQTLFRVLLYIVDCTINNKFNNGLFCRRTMNVSSLGVSIAINQYIYYVTWRDLHPITASLFCIIQLRRVTFLHSFRSAANLLIQPSHTINQICYYY